ncbi:MAG: phosphatidylglycerophosphatase A [Candidatus Acidiferrales bacterium]
MTPGAEPRSSDAATPTASPATAGRKPRFALFIATACGLGYLPKAPGTWGSLAGVALYWGIFKICALWIQSAARLGAEVLPASERLSSVLECFLAPMLLVLGIWASDVVSKYSGVTDPQFVVVDEVSGQQLALLLGTRWAMVPNWKYLLLGLILFRVFDIWKPFPARQAESLPGGWGIMADDWIAGVYAAIGLWIARAAGL